MRTKRSFRKNRSTRKHSGGVKKSHLLMGALGLGSLAGASAAPAQGPSILGSGQRWSNGPGRSANNYKNTAQMTMRNNQRPDSIVNYQGPGLSTIRKMNRAPVVVRGLNTAGLEQFKFNMGKGPDPMASPIADYKGPGLSTMRSNIMKIIRDPVVVPRTNTAALQEFKMASPIADYQGPGLSTIRNNMKKMNRVREVVPINMGKGHDPMASPIADYQGPGLSTMRNNIKKMNRVHEVVPINMGQNVKPNQKAWQMNVNPDWSAIGKMNRVRNVGALPNMGKYYVPAENMGSFQENWKAPVWNAGRARDLERNFKFDVKPDFNQA